MKIFCGNRTSSCLIMARKWRFMMERMTVGSEEARERWYEMDTDSETKMEKRTCCACAEWVRSVTPPYAKPTKTPGQVKIL